MLSRRQGEIEGRLSHFQKRAILKPHSLFLAATCLLCLLAPLLSFPIPAFSAEDLAGAVALAGPLLQGPSILASKGLALISAAANAAAPDGDAPLAPELLDGVQASLQVRATLLGPEP